MRKGYTYSPEARAKKKALRDAYWTPERREEYRVRFSGKVNPFFGKKHTEETKIIVGQKGTGRPAWNKGIACTYGEKVSKTLTGKKQSTETILKRVAHFKGEKHWKWKEDRNTLAKHHQRGDVAYGEWRMNVYRRDNFKCRIADENCKGRIEAHHILSWTDYPELRYKVNNGITLCHAHHPRKRAEEKRLSPYF